jgi:hypothetical protein
MQVTVLLTLPPDQDRSRSWLPDALTALGHDVVVVDRPGLEPDRAAALGYQVADTWTADGRTSCSLLAGSPAWPPWSPPGRSRCPSCSASPCRALRLGGRHPGGARTGPQRGPTARPRPVRAGRPGRPGCTPGRDPGAARARRRRASAASPTTPPAGAEPVVVATDDSAADISAVLEGMAAGRAAVVVDRGILGDLVADHVTGLVVRADGTCPQRCTPWPPTGCAGRPWGWPRPTGSRPASPPGGGRGARAAGRRGRPTGVRPGLRTPRVKVAAPGADDLREAPTGGARPSPEGTSMRRLLGRAALAGAVRCSRSVRPR